MKALSGDAHSTAVNSAGIAVLSRRGSVTAHVSRWVAYLWVCIDCIDVGDVMLYRAKVSVRESNAQ